LSDGGQTFDFNAKVPRDATGYREYVAIHELLHNLGLLDTAVSASFPQALNLSPYTIMSYNKIARETNYGQPSSPMAIDIAALHHLYGAVHKATNDSIYKLIDQNQNRDLNVEDGSMSIGRGLFAIWD